MSAIARKLEPEVRRPMIRPLIEGVRSFFATLLEDLGVLGVMVGA